MANKAVVGAAATAGLLYAATEHFKDYRASQEKKEREQLLRDERDDYARRQEEAARKRGDRAATEDAEEEYVSGRLFRTLVYAHMEDMLFKLAVQVGEKGGLTTTSEGSKFKQLNLPLMSTKYGKEDIILAAAFALGDPDVVDKVTHLFPKQSLGLGLRKFSSEAIAQIIQVFESFEEPDIEHNDLSLLISRGAYSSEFLKGIPSLSFFKLAYSDNLAKWGERLGFHVLRKSELHAIYQPRKKQYRFQYIKGSTSGDQDDGAGVALSNFFCDFFTVPSKDDEDGEHVYPDLSQISLPGKAQQTKRGRRKKSAGKESSPPLRTPDPGAMATVLARKIVGGIARAAVQRLRHLCSRRRRGDELFSHDHIAVTCGNGSELLGDLRKSDMYLIKTNKDNIAFTLQRALKQSVPAPPDNCQSPGKFLENEISCFVDSYIKLVNLSYCEVPLVGGAPPSYYVPEYCVRGESLQAKGCIWEPRPLLSRGTRRLLEKSERERLMQSRELVAPGTFYSCLFAVLSWALLSWLTAGITKMVLRIIYPAHPLIFFLFMSQGFTLWSLRSLVQIFAKIFNCEDKAWNVVACCTEYFQRAAAAKLGKPTPYDQALENLRVSCKDQYCVWKLRIAKREFHAALKRKRIGYRDSVLLLIEFAERHYETENDEIVEGTLPVDLNEAEAFLKLRVEEGTPFAEASLSPNDALKNYLEIEGEDSHPSFIDNLNQLSGLVEEVVQFSEGDRVIVAPDENGINEIDDHDSYEYNDALVSRKSKIGSVVFVTAILCFVHFDGEPGPRPVSIHRCTILEKNPILALKNDASESYSSDSEVEEMCLISEAASDSPSISNKTNDIRLRITGLGHHLIIDVDSDATVWDLKCKIERRTSIPTARQKLKARGKLLENNGMLIGMDSMGAGYRIDSGTRLVLLHSQEVCFDGMTGDSNTNSNQSSAKHKVTPRAKDRGRTVEEALVEGGWKFVRAKKHIIFSRRVQLSSGKSQKQNLTLPKTPSDYRAMKNALANIRRLNFESAGLLDESTESEEEDEDASYVQDCWCSSCHSTKHMSHFSSSQLKKGDKRRCKKCVG